MNGVRSLTVTFIVIYTPLATPVPNVNYIHEKMFIRLIVGIVGITSRSVKWSNTSRLDLNNKTEIDSALCLKQDICLYTVKPVFSGHSKRRPKLVCKTDCRLMQVKSIAECSKRAFCNTFDLH